mmetsp:Transcript_13508/g.40285  ORF Transcript_13508/g.40285 Transcript_13508/m.40285 type:complete len:134 (-) Transcript_13508:34-435(-)
MYYLNKNMCAWRHFAVTGCLLSLPLFIASTAFRLVVKLDRQNEKVVENDEMPASPPFEEQFIGWAMFSWFILMALIICYVHYRHDAIFTERYKGCQMALSHHQNALNIMSSRSARSRPHDGLQRTPLRTQWAC